MINCLIVGSGGFLGTVLRYLIGLIPLREGTVFPFKTFAINIFGAFLIGIVAALAARECPMNEKLVLFLKAGVCGGFTTFSSFALETGDMFRSGHGTLAVLYVVLSVLLGILAVIVSQKIIG